MKQIPYWEPTILECPVCLALIQPFMLGAFELTHASVRKKEAAIIKLKILDATVWNPVVRDFAHPCFKSRLNINLIFKPSLMSELVSRLHDFVLNYTLCNIPGHTFRKPPNSQAGAPPPVDWLRHTIRYICNNPPHPNAITFIRPWTTNQQVANIRILYKIKWRPSPNLFLSLSILKLGATWREWLAVSQCHFCLEGNSDARCMETGYAANWFGF